MQRCNALARALNEVRISANEYGAVSQAQVDEIMQMDADNPGDFHLYGVRVRAACVCSALALIVCVVQHGSAAAEHVALALVGRDARPPAVGDSHGRRRWWWRARALAGAAGAVAACGVDAAPVGDRSLAAAAAARADTRHAPGDRGTLLVGARMRSRSRVRALIARRARTRPWT
jgi:hypothetical protein